MFKINDTARLASSLVQLFHYAKFPISKSR